MTPNCFGKSAFVFRSESYFPREQTSGPYLIRTEFILRNIFSHVIKPITNFRPTSALNERERKILRKLMEIVDEFKKNYQADIQDLFLCLNIDLDALGNSLSGISNELFSEGIAWSQIVTFFAFVGEFTAQCVSKTTDRAVIDEIYFCFEKFVIENLEHWVQDHGGWEGILALSASPKSRNKRHYTDIKVFSPNASFKIWTRTLLFATVRMIGTFAHIANAAQAYP